MATSKTTVQIVMPAMGESVTEGVVLGWLKQVGDAIDLDEPIVEVSTDKVDAEVPAPAAGVLTKVLVEADETVEVGAVLGEIETGQPSERTDEPSDRSAGASDGADGASDGTPEQRERTERSDGGTRESRAAPAGTGGRLPAPLRGR